MVLNSSKIDTFGTFLDAAQRTTPPGPPKFASPYAEQGSQNRLGLAKLFRVLRLFRERSMIPRKDLQSVQQATGLDFEAFLETLRFLLQSNMITSVGETGNETLTLTPLGCQFSDILAEAM
jgi:hypothetical protein